MELLRSGLDALLHSRSFDLHPSLGPHFVADSPREIEIDVDDAVAWVVGSVLPTANTEPVVRSRGPHRDTIGYEFFERRRVAEYVRKDYQPARALAVRDSASHLPAVSHYVQGAHRLLLMEPVITRRQSWEKDIATVVRTFYAYQTAVLPMLEARSIEAELLVYLVGGGPADVRARAKQAMQPAAKRVIDVHDDRVAKRFAAEIVEIGKTAPPQGELALS